MVLLDKMSIQINDFFTLSRLSYKQLLALNLKPWKGQRKLNEDRIQDLGEKILHDYNLSGRWLILNPFVLVKHDREHYILDGQHRYEALCWIFKHNSKLDKNFNVPIAWLNSDNNYELDKMYLILNSVEEQPVLHMSRLKEKVEPKITSDTKILDSTLSLLEAKYENFDCDKDPKQTTRRPKINGHYILECLKKHDIVNIYGIDSGDKLFDCMCKLDDRYRELDSEYFCDHIIKYEKNKKAEQGYIEKFFDQISDRNYHMLGLFKPTVHHDKVWIADLEDILSEYPSSPLIEF